MDMKPLESEGPAPSEAAPKKSPRREELGLMLRELEVILANYHDSPAAHRREGDAGLFAQWVAARERLFDALSDLTAENESLRAALRGRAAVGEPPPPPLGLFAAAEKAVMVWREWAFARDEHELAFQETMHHLMDAVTFERVAQQGRA